MNVGAVTTGLPFVDRSTATVPAAGNFSNLLDRVLEQMSAPGRLAEQAVTDLAMGKTDNLHQVLLTVAQADLAFRLMLEVRNKLVDAYQEIQRMQV